ncbi:MAG: hypothetical protein ACE5KQ_04530 [Thermoplasmata archaeon]
MARQGNRFQGLVLGLDRHAVEGVLRLHGLALRISSYSPPMSLALGLAGKRLLEGQAIPSSSGRFAGRLLLGIWGAVAVLFFLTLSSFALGLWEGLRLPLLIGTVGLGLVALILTVILYRRRAIGQELDTDDFAYFPWDILIVPEFALVGLAMALVVLFFGFVLLILWIPALFLLVNLLALGELWRSYRTVLVSGEGVERLRLGRAAGDLLRRGGVLSRSWEPYLPAENVGPAARLRRAHFRVHESLLLLSIFSLAFAVLFVGARVFPAETWMPVLLVTGILVLLATGGILWALFRRSRVRPLP